MAIDLKVLFSAIQGDQEKKIEVKRSWLSEVYRLLLEGQKAKEELARLKAAIAAQCDEENDPFGAKWDKTWKDFDSTFDKLFGKGLFKRGK